MCDSIVVVHPAAEFEPSCWGDYFVNLTPLTREGKQEMEEEVRILKETVQKEFAASVVNKPTIEQLEFIDAMERLGLAYHFQTDIEKSLDNLHNIYLKENKNYNLYHVSTGFRVFRQHGFNISSCVFERFRSKSGFHDIMSSNDLEGVLGLYEASHVGCHGEKILEEALEFTTTCLKRVVDQGYNNNSPLFDQVAHALHQPLHKGIIRLESRHYISFYQNRPSHNANLLKFAKLDFNLLQSLHQIEMRDLAIWWKELHGKVPPTRDRSVEGYFWALGCYYEPHYSFARKIFTRMFMVQQLLDDMYDSYGNFEDRKLLTEAVNRWDYSYVNKMGGYFRDCYKALLETFDEAEQDLANDGRAFCIHYAKHQMQLNCQAWFKEAEWCSRKYIPKFDEYMKVSLISIGHITGIATAFLGMGEVVSREGYEWSARDPMPPIVKGSDIILRLLNDIGGHKYEQHRGHVASSVECYMRQYGTSDEKQVYRVLEEKVKDGWKDVNKGMLKPYPVPKALLDRILNFARVPEVMYKGRSEGYTLVNQTIKQKIASVLVHPIAL